MGAKIKSIIAISASVGYSRCLRWTLAFIPALKLTFDPLKRFFFCHIDVENDDGVMHFAESVGMLIPERKSRIHLGSAASLKKGSKKTFLHRHSSDAFNTSQMGLSYDASPDSSHHDLQSMGSTEVSHESTDHSPFLVPSHPHISMQNSPSKNRKSVHFGLGEGAPFVEEIDYDLDYSFTYSSNDLSSSPIS